jgi:hypothetical protein
MDVMDVDDPLALEKAFSPDTAFFGNGYAVVSPDVAADPSAAGEAAAGMSDAAAAAMEAYFKPLMSGIQGTLFKDEHLDLYYRHEYRGSQARVTLMYKNVSASGPLTGIDVALVKAAPMIRGHLPKHADTIAPGTTQTQLLVVELMTPFAEPPQLHVAFTAGGARYKYPIPLPLTLTHFLSPVVLGANHFGGRWDAMGVGNEAVAEGSTKLSMDPASFNSVHGRLRTIKLGLGLDALDESGEGLFCAAAMHTKTRQKGAQGRVLLGLMAKVLVKGKELKVTVRAPTEKAAALLAECIVAQLSDGP